MTRFGFLLLAGAAVALSACSSDAPRAPMGFDKRPANSAATMAELSARAGPTQTSQTLPAPVSAPTPDPRSSGAARETGFRAIVSPPADRPPIVPGMTISDYAAPRGLTSLPAGERARLVAVARSARQISVYCRGDQARPSPGAWQVIFHRGVELKRFLVAHGVDAARIRLFVRSAGGFVADNRHPSGRAKNRRVDIRFA